MLVSAFQPVASPPATNGQKWKWNCLLCALCTNSAHEQLININIQRKEKTTTIHIESTIFSFNTVLIARVTKFHFFFYQVNDRKEIKWNLINLYLKQLYWKMSHKVNQFKIKFFKDTQSHSTFTRVGCTREKKNKTNNNNNIVYAMHIYGMIWNI